MMGEAAHIAVDQEAGRNKGTNIPILPPAIFHPARHTPHFQIFFRASQNSTTGQGPSFQNSPWLIFPIQKGSNREKNAAPCHINSRAWWSMEGSHGQGKQDLKVPCSQVCMVSHRQWGQLGVIQSDTTIFSNCKMRKSRPENMRERNLDDSKFSDFKHCLGTG